MVCTAIDIVRSAEGLHLRERLMRNIVSLRTQLQASGLPMMGELSPIVPVLVRSEALARQAARSMPEQQG